MLPTYSATGSNHETHVDTFQKKKAVKALQKAKPEQVNDLITILKAMPDPTVKEFKTVHSREASRQDHHPSSPETTTTPPSPPLPPLPVSSPSEDKGKDRNTEDNANGDSAGSSSGETSSKKDGEGKSDAKPDSEALKAPSSWWAVSFASLTSSIGPTPSTTQPSVTTTTTTVTTVVLTEDEAESSAVEAGSDQAASTSKSDPQEPTETPPEEVAETVVVRAAGTEADKGTTGKGKKGTITKTTTSSTTVSVTNEADKSVLTSTINSIKKQVAALIGTPPIDVISAYTYWWGYEIYVPHKCMSKLQRVSNISQIFFGFLSGAVGGVPGLAALVPLSRIISAWVGFQWALIQAEDLGKGVVLSATWVLPVALAPRSWDHPGTEDEPHPADPQQKAIEAA
ncbi:hypothetical protein B0O80DRAFT_199813 [Mortierella sp. GBAus27b]|nr:hypothetical protein B0O80DRAFT_199813 [Mortierella sp. GBAus27b]